MKRIVIRAAPLAFCMALLAVVSASAGVGAAHGAQTPTGAMEGAHTDSVRPGAAAAVRNRSVRDTESPDRFAPDLDRAFRRFGQGLSIASSDSASAPAQIDLVLHVLSGPSGEGDVSDAVLREQLAVLNDAYRPSGLQFNLDVRRHRNSPYFNGGCFPTTESGIQMKSELAVDPAHFVNVYTCRLDLPFIAGYGTLPNAYPEDDRQHGVIVDYASLIGGPEPLDLGHTLVHELGHYFGLLHTFEDGCAEPGDSVADTPAEALPAHGCEVGRDTCAQAGADPISNFMDYSDDQCTNAFSPLQNARMRTLIAAYRPHLIGAAFAIGPGMTGNWFDPDQSGHGFSIEVLADNQMLAQWYVFAPDGGQVWIVASGPISGDRAVLQGYREDGAGARFPPVFNPLHLQAQFWGTLTFTFTDCNNGQASWESALPGYANGTIPITRLTMPAGLSCP